MKKLLTTIMCLILITGISTMKAQTSTNTEVPSKLVKNEHGSWQLIVNGKPFIMLAGELHNSSASTTEYLNNLWTPLKTLNLNTVLAPIAWEQFEPQEGIFDYTLIDNMIDGARKNGLKLSILWFGSWKNGESSYAPTWVKEDTKRFFRIQNIGGTHQKGGSGNGNSHRPATGKRSGYLSGYGLLESLTCGIWTGGSADTYPIYEKEPQKPA